jgi:hypothetical protein
LIVSAGFVIGVTVRRERRVLAERIEEIRGV